MQSSYVSTILSWCQVFPEVYLSGWGSHWLTSKLEQKITCRRRGIPKQFDGTFQIILPFSFRFSYEDCVPWAWNQMPQRSRYPSCQDWSLGSIYTARDQQVFVSANRDRGQTELIQWLEALMRKRPQRFPKLLPQRSDMGTINVCSPNKKDRTTCRKIWQETLQLTIVGKLPG